MMKKIGNDKEYKRKMRRIRDDKGFVCLLM